MIPFTYFPSFCLSYLLRGHGMVYLTSFYSAAGRSPGRIGKESTPTIQKAEIKGFRGYRRGAPVTLENGDVLMDLTPPWWKRSRSSSACATRWACAKAQAW